MLSPGGTPGPTRNTWRSDCRWISKGRSCKTSCRVPARPLTTRLSQLDHHGALVEFVYLGGCQHDLEFEVRYPALNCPVCQIGFLAAFLPRIERSRQSLARITRWLGGYDGKVRVSELCSPSSAPMRTHAVQSATPPDRKAPATLVDPHRHARSAAIPNRAPSRDTNRVYFDPQRTSHFLTSR